MLSSETLVLCHKCTSHILTTPPPEPSPITPLLTSNNVPEPHEVAIVLEVIRSCSTVVAQIDELMAQVARVLGILQAQRSEYEEHIEKHEKVLSKVRVLPIGVLSEIFLRTLPQGEDQDSMMKFNTLDQDFVPWTLTRVCRSWRAAALLTPALWTRLPYFQFGPGSLVESQPEALALLRRSLDISPSIPFSVNLGLDPMFPAHLSNPQFTHLLFPHSNRFEHMTVHGHHRDISQRLSQIQGNLKSLRSLSLYLIGSTINLTDPSLPVTTFVDAPRLQDLHLSFSPTQQLVHLQSYVALPWTQLCHASIGRIAVGGLATLLSSAPALQECVIDELVQEASSVPSFTSAALRRLRIRIHSSSDALNLFFSHTTLPSLQKLSLTVLCLDIVPLVTFVSRSSCPLTLLYVTFVRCNGHLARLFGALPSLTDLGMSYRYDLLEDILRKDESGVAVLPRLRHLLLRFPRTRDIWTPSGMHPGAGPTCLSEDYQRLVYELERADLASLDTLTLDRLSLKHQDAFFLALDRWSDVQRNVYDRLLSDWNDSLRQIIHPETTIIESLKLDKILSEIESHPEISARYIHGNPILKQLPQDLALLPADQESLRLRGDSIFARWWTSLDEYLNAVGWRFSKETRTLVYGRRRGSLTVKGLVQSHDPFASFKEENGFVMLPASSW
ncbi:unnamed protein product [Cyclocybe aegerita]|uniref:F-box domain-containing protein n=1 Tax=Cyclocybe aegerita TaxID=1973307 RepID=A0A8S0XSC5_CYCAE|nr:unnamed protein product [Cyclocybe aegerita]